MERSMRPKMTVSAILCAFAVLLLIGGTAYAQITPTIEYLTAALRHQDQLAGDSLQLTYQVSRHKSDSVPVPIREIRYVRTASLIRMEDTAKGSGLVEISSYNRTTNEARSLGKRLSDGSIVGATTTIEDVSPRLTCLNMMETAVLYVLMRPLYEAITEGTVACQESVDQHVCWRVDISAKKLGYTDDATISVWLDPSIGYCPRRLNRPVNGSLDVLSAFSIDFKNYKDIGNGVWFPSEQVFSHGGEDIKTSLTLESADIGKTPGELLVTFPSGTRVWNENVKEYTTVP